MKEGTKKGIHRLLESIGVIFLALMVIGMFVGKPDKSSSQKPSDSAAEPPKQEQKLSTDDKTDSKEPEKKTATSTPTKATKAVDTYESILAEYTEKLQAATPGLIEEYNSEAAGNTEGIQGLAQISNAKVTKLAGIESEGTSKMAGVMYGSGSGSYDEYEEWAGKLYEVYEAEASKIMDAYMESAM
ncbi:hypothetical protein HMPREF1008_00429 [Olsenella sp. oral taxon 809 str. F0356]|uniref:hypothetical protein n=1 Tax=Olsenella sp. oral taxon 809 TaxID=661086 RepID=UPI000231F2DF|nr:hypothetical protein [Olsenella sp. oral taxon 809]EHF02784.1 hypothetical protein HMPREF1008_00429 [Olsenella sp. oral taxon 809 str. F0356]